jgi:ABC-2 type transport system permease protein
MGVIKKLFLGKWGIVFLALVLIGINYVASFSTARLDVTNEKRFTLSAPTKKLLRGLTEPIAIDVFLKGSFPSGFAKLSKRTEEMLELFKETAGNKLTFNFINVNETVAGSNITWADSLTNVGITPINLTSQLADGAQQQNIFPLALVYHKDAIYPVDIYAGNKRQISHTEINAAEAQMEFKFAQAIYKATQTKRAQIGYAIGHGEPADARTYDLGTGILDVDYQWKTFNLAEQPAVPEVCELLIIAKPTKPFTEYDQLKIDQYLLRGGKLLCFIDKLDAEADSLGIVKKVVAYDRGLQLNDLFFKYGARINSDLLLDLQCDYLPFDVNGKGQFEFLHWNYFPLFESKNNHIINKNLGLTAGKFVNSIDTIEVEGITKTVLLSTSENTKSLATPAIISGAENINAPVHETFKKKNVPVSVLLEGKFTSAFRYRVPQALKDSFAKINLPILETATNEGKVIIVADGDFVLNSISKQQPLEMGTNVYTLGSQYEYTFANKAFVQNSLEYMLNAGGLLEAKAKDYKLRILNSTKVKEEKTFWQNLCITLPILLVLVFAVVYQFIHKKQFTRK